MASLVFYSRLVTRVLGGSFLPDSCKESSSHAVYSSQSVLTESPRRRQPLLPFKSSTTPSLSYLVSFQSKLAASPGYRDLFRLLPNAVTPAGFLLRSRPSSISAARSLCSAPAIEGAPATTSATSPEARRELALRLVTAQCGFAKDHFPPAARPGRGRTSDGWIDTVRRRWTRDSSSDAMPEPTPTLPPSSGRAACFGDDAFFVTANSAGDVLGVADGVGGWRTYGIDPSLFSSSLMATCQRVVAEGRSRLDAPKTIIATGYYDLMESSRKSRPKGPTLSTSRRSSGLVGSSTVCIVAFDRATQRLHAANLGDSGFAVVRDGKVIRRSREQQHYFNTPFQLSLPPRPASRGATSSMLQDSPEMAEASTVAVKEGDVIVVATDGLWDNLDENMIVEEIQTNLKDPKDEASVARTARALATRARRLAFDPEYMSPFAKAARAAGIQKVVGGKPDDITILLSAVAAS